jgi:hypothetical protein
MLAIWILSVFYFALAAPVAVGEKIELRSDAVDAFKDVIVVREKRWDSRADDPMSEDGYPMSEDAQNDDDDMSDDEQNNDNSMPDAASDSDSDSDDSDGDDNSHNYEDNVSDNENDNDNTSSPDPVSDSEDESDRGGGGGGYEGDYESDGEKLPEIPEHMTVATYVEEVLGRLRPRRR